MSAVPGTTAAGRSARSQHRMLPLTDTSFAQRGVEMQLLKLMKPYLSEEKYRQLWYYLDVATGTVEDGLEKSEGDQDLADESDARKSSPSAVLHRRAHRSYVMDHLVNMSESSQGLHASQPWLVYWSLHAADLLGITSEVYEQLPAHAIAEYLYLCLKDENQCGPELPGATQAGPIPTVKEGETGSSSQPCDDDLCPASRGLGFRQRFAADAHVGFAGGTSGHQPHLAPSYAAVSALCILGDPQYIQQLPRAAIKRWLRSLRSTDGSFRMHVGGEADVRASYCVSVIVTLLQLDDEVLLEGPACAARAFVDPGDVKGATRSTATLKLAEEAVLTDTAARFVAASQTAEGGFACNPISTEAHGAYTHCALSALLLMKAPHLCNYTELRRWLCSRQLAMEGGFNGRTNKLVDSCYSHWVGSAHVLLRVGEAYCKLLGLTPTFLAGGHSSGAAPPDNAEGGASEAVPLRAREILLLDHAQLLDATELVTPVNAEEWDCVEKRHRDRAQLTQQFLSTASCGASRDHEAATANSASSSAFGDVPFEDEEVGDYYFNQRRLQLYVLRCCQNQSEGGLMDKPGYPNDAYHTCYSLSGVSSAQNSHYAHYHAVAKEVASTSRSARGSRGGEQLDPGFGGYLKSAWRCGYLPRGGTTAGDAYGIVLGIEKPMHVALSSLLRSTNPIFNINRARVLSALQATGMKTFV